MRDAKLRTKFLFRTYEYFAKFSARKTEYISKLHVFMRLAMRSRISLTIEKQRDM